MRESDFQTKFNLWVKYNIKTSSAFELKLTKEKSLAFSAVMPHQLLNLSLAKNGSLAYKIEDGNYAPKPFDSFILVNVPAYVVVMFYHRGQKTFYMIDVDVFIKEKETSDRKSLTVERAGQIGKVCCLA